MREIRNDDIDLYRPLKQKKDHNHLSKAKLKL